MIPLKDAIQEHAESVSLSDEEFEKLLADNAPSDANPSRRWVAWVALAAALLIALGLWWPFGGSVHHDIAEEVVYNHQKLKPLEIESASPDELAAFFGTQDVRIVRNSKVLGDRDWELLGGRFCSIQGADAAQLRFRDADGQLLSVYMAPYSESKMGPLPDVDAGAEPLRTVSDGREVWIWREQNQIVASTAPEAAD